MLFCRPAPAARGSLPVSKSLSGKHKLEAGRFPPSSKSRRRVSPTISSHQGASSERGFPSDCGRPIAALTLFLLFPALKSEAEAEPARRNRPIASRSSPFSSISAFNLPKSIIIVLRHCVYLANPQTALVFVLLKLKACARLHECWFSRT